VIRRGLRPAPAAASRIIQLRWRCGADDSVTNTGWFLDNIAVGGLVAAPVRPSSILTEA